MNHRTLGRPLNPSSQGLIRWYRAAAPIRCRYPIRCAPLDESVHGAITHCAGRNQKNTTAGVCFVDPRKAALSGNLKAETALDATAHMAGSNVFSRNAMCFVLRAARCGGHLSP